MLRPDHQKGPMPRTKALIYLKSGAGFSVRRIGRPVAECARRALRISGATTPFWAGICSQMQPPDRHRRRRGRARLAHAPARRSLGLLHAAGLPALRRTEPQKRNKACAKPVSNLKRLCNGAARSGDAEVPRTSFLVTVLVATRTSSGGCVTVVRGPS